MGLHEQADLPGIQVLALLGDLVGREEVGEDLEGVEPVLVRPGPVEVDGGGVPDPPAGGAMGHVNEVVAVVQDIVCGRIGPGLGERLSAHSSIWPNYSPLHTPTRYSLHSYSLQCSSLNQAL